MVESGHPRQEPTVKETAASKSSDPSGAVVVGAGAVLVKVGAGLVVVVVGVGVVVVVVGAGVRGQKSG